MGHCVMDHFVMGRFVMGHFICESVQLLPEITSEIWNVTYVATEGRIKRSCFIVCRLAVAICVRRRPMLNSCRSVWPVL
jgi:hypothetical protein